MGLRAVIVPTADAACGGVATARPTKRLGHFRAPLAIGDSVLLGAIPQVAAEGFEINTRGRGWTEGERVVRARRRAGTLPHELLMFLGADWPVSRKQIADVLHPLGPQRVLVLVTPREVGGGERSDAEHIRQMGRRYPTRILVLDWVRYTRRRAGWFGPDGLHLSYGGAHGLARFLRNALPFAAPGQFPGPDPVFAPDPPQPAPPPTAP